jgi:hypothetical protein
MKKFSYSIIAVIFLFSLFWIPGCESLLPEDYQEDETYTVPELDEIACGFLSRDLDVLDTIIVGVDTTAVPRYKELDGTLLDQVLVAGVVADSDSVIIDAKFDSLTTVMDTLIADTTLLINYPGEATAYLLFNYVPPAGQTSGTVHIYSSLIFNAENLHTFLQAELLTRKAATIATTSVAQMDLETIAGCSEFVEIAGTGDQYIVPKIRGRDSFDLPQGIYLVRFTPSETAGLETLIVTVIEE